MGSPLPCKRLLARSQDGEEKQHRDEWKDTDFQVSESSVVVRVGTMSDLWANGVSELARAHAQ